MDISVALRGQQVISTHDGRADANQTRTTVSAFAFFALAKIGLKCWNVCSFNNVCDCSFVRALGHCH